MEDKKNENEFLFYVVDVETQENQEDKKQEVEQKEKSNISIEKNTDDRLNKFIYDIFAGCNKYDENDKYYVINNLQMNLIINEIEWHKEFTECILKEEVELIRKKNINGFMFYSYSNLENNKSYKEVSNLVKILD